MGQPIVTVVALYGPKADDLRNLLQSVQATLTRKLGTAFLPYSLDQIHGTLVRLDGFRDPASGALLNQRYLEQQGARRAMDLGQVMHLLERHLSPPLSIRIGGFGPADEVTFTSQGKHPYERTFSARGGAFVLIGWPVTAVRPDGGRKPLDDLRRSMSDANVLHFYHATATDVDDDFHLVIGHYADPADEALAESVRMVRRDLERCRVDLQIGLDQVRIVASDSPALTPARFIGKLPVAASELASLYGESPALPAANKDARFRF